MAPAVVTLAAAGRVGLLIGLLMPATAFAQSQVSPPFATEAVRKMEQKTQAASGTAQPGAPAKAEPAKKAEPGSPTGAPAAEGRDPFEPLVTRPQEGADRPSLSGLRLVGILWDPVHREQIRALVETPDGLGYYVRLNEEKFGGKVIAIERDRVKFSVREQEPGGQARSRTVELKLYQ